MKSRISFFDTATFKKDITRFMPLWVLYTVFLLLCMIPTVAGGSFYSSPARALNSSLEALTFASFLYAALCAQLLFGELFNSRLCNAIHAMPVTREARFGSHILAGVLFAWVPNLLVSLLMLPYLDHLWFTSFLWLGAYSLQYLFFFGAAVFSVMCTGSRFAMVLVYGIVNLLSVVVYWFLNAIYAPLMPGVEINTEWMVVLCPLVLFMTQFEYFEIATHYPSNYYPNNYYGNGSAYSTFEGLGESWSYLFIVAGVGIAALVAALLMYRKRKLESAGDFIAVKWIAPIFLVLYTLCVGAFLTVFGSLFGTDAIAVLLIPGLLIGFFTGRMLLDRTIRVFKKRNFLLAGILLAAMLFSLVPVRLDWFGVIHYVPDAEDVAHIEVRSSGISRSKVDDPEDIALACQVHRAALDDLDHEDVMRTCNAQHLYFRVIYHMKDGRRVERYYTICGYSAAGSLLGQLVRKIG